MILYWPRSGLCVESSRRLEVCWGRLPVGGGLRLRLKVGLYRLLVGGGLRLPTYYVSLVAARIVAFGTFVSRACLNCVDVGSK